MGAIREFNDLNGSVNSDMYPEVDIDGERVFKDKITGIYKPAEEVFYKDKKVIYQIAEISDKEGLIIVPGYRVSEPYEAVIGDEIDFGEKMGDEKIVHNPNKTLAVKVELIDEKDQSEIRGLIRRITGNKFCVNFW